MENVKRMMESCGNDVSAMCDVVDSIGKNGTHEEFMEAASILRANAVKIIRSRTLQVSSLLLDRHLKGAANKLAEEAGVSLDQVQSIQIVMK